MALLVLLCLMWTFSGTGGQSAPVMSITPAGPKILFPLGHEVLLKCHLENIPPDEAFQNPVWIHSIHTEEGTIDTNILHGVQFAMSRGNSAKYNVLEIRGFRESDADNYTCVATSDTRTIRKSVTLLMFEDIEFTEAPSHQTFTAGSDVLVLCQATGEPKPEVTFRHKGRKIPDGGRYRVDSKGLRIFNITTEDRGEYICRAEVSADGRMQQVVINVTVNETSLPELTVHPRSKTILYPEGRSILLFCTISPKDSSVQLKWLDLDGEEIKEEGVRKYVEYENANKNDVKLYILFIEPWDSGLYTCVEEGHGTSRQIQTELLLYVPIKVIAPKRQVFERCTDILIRCSATGNPMPEVSIRRHGRVIHTGGKYIVERQGLRILNPSSEDGGKYLCQAYVRDDGRIKEKSIFVSFL